MKIENNSKVNAMKEKDILSIIVERENFLAFFKAEIKI